MSNLLSLGLIGKSQGGAHNSDDALALITLPFVLPVVGIQLAAEAIGSSCAKLAKKFSDRAEKIANKKKHEELAKTYPTISEGKIGTVEEEMSEDGKTKVTIIHTKYGPFIKTETNDYSEKKKNGESLERTSVSYTGFLVVLDEKGNKTLTYLDNVGHSVSDRKIINANHDEGFWFNRQGSTLTKEGEMLSLSHFDIVEDYCLDRLEKLVREGFIGGLEERFEELLEKAHQVSSSSTID